MTLSRSQSSLLDYLARCTFATPKTILRVKGHGRNVVEALRRRGLVEYRPSPAGYTRVYITEAGLDQHRSNAPP